MPCPRCATLVDDAQPTCSTCGFGLADLDAKLGAPPAPLGRLSDFAGLLSGDARGRIEERLRAFEEQSGGVQLRVVTRETTAPCTPREYCFWLFARWNVGDVKADENNGVLLLLSKAERAIECEVGHALEAVVTDEAAGKLLESHVVPVLARGEVDEGIGRAVDVLSKLIVGGEDPRSWWQRLLGR
jgi:uncharacterized protein